MRCSLLPDLPYLHLKLFISKRWKISIEKSQLRKPACHYLCLLTNRPNTEIEYIVSFKSVQSGPFSVHFSSFLKDTISSTTISIRFNKKRQWNFKKNRKDIFIENLSPYLSHSVQSGKCIYLCTLLKYNELVHFHF